MRILEIAPPWFTVPPRGYGGIEQIVALLCDGLVARGHDVTLFASGGSVTDAKLRSVYDVPPSEQLGSAPHELAHLLDAFADAGDFDVVHDHSGVIGAALGARLQSTPYVHTVHGDWDPAVVSVYQKLGDRIGLVTISGSQARTAPPGVNVIGSVPNGIDVEQFSFHEHADAEGPLAFVGRANATKGPEVAVAVAAKLGRPLRMAVKVNEAAEHEYWREVVVPLLDGVAVDVVLNGGRDAAITAMAGASATLVPISWEEPFGLVMVESMACGTPVVAYARGAACEVVADGRSGVLVPPGDEGVMCAVVEEIARIDRAECRRWVTERYSAAVMVDGYERVLLEAAREGTDRRRRVDAIS